MADSFYDRLDQVLDSAREGQKRSDTVDALDALYAEQSADLAKERDAARAEVERLHAELEEIRQHDETTGGVLYDVIRRTLAGELDEHQAVRQIERRLIQPLIAQRREALATAARAAGRRRHAAVAQRDAVALAAEKTVTEVTAERDAAREQVKRTETAVHAFFADADQRGVHLDGMTVDELCDAVMAAIRKEPGQ